MRPNRLALLSAARKNFALPIYRKDRSPRCLQSEDVVSRAALRMLPMASFGASRKPVPPMRCLMRTSARTGGVWRRWRVAATVTSFHRTGHQGGNEGGARHIAKQRTSTLPEGSAASILIAPNRQTLEPRLLGHDFAQPIVAKVTRT